MHLSRLSLRIPPLLMAILAVRTQLSSAIFFSSLFYCVLFSSLRLIIIIIPIGCADCESRFFYIQIQSKDK